MSIITKMRKQKCVYWGSPVPDGFGGHTFASPVELSCRWETTNELFLSTNGEESVSKAAVYVGQDLEEGGYLWLGLLEDLTETADPRLVPRAGVIRSFMKTPNISAREFLRKAIL